MGLFKQKQDWYQKLEDQRKEPVRSNFVEKKRNSILRTYEEPVMPKLCKILFISMFILTAAMLLEEISAFLRYSFTLGILHFLVNLSTTGLTIWSIYAAILVVACFIGIRLNITNFWKKKRESGITEQTEEDRKRNRRAIHRLNTGYWLYIKVCLIGFLVWLVFYIVVFFQLR